MISLHVLRRRYTDVPFAVVFGFVGINNLINLIVHPGQQAASLLASPLDYFWGSLYATGGLLILIGLGIARANVEAAGCVAFGGGAFISALTLAILNGWASWNQIFLLALFATMAMVRARHLARGQVLILVAGDTLYLLPKPQ